MHTGDAKNSTSMQRAPADSSSFIRGKTGHFPFAPGSLRLGLHLDEDSDEEQDGGGVVDAFEKGLELSRGGIQTIPPGFERGLDFDGDAEAEELFDEGQQKSNIDLRPIYRPALANDAEQVCEPFLSSEKPFQCSLLLLCVFFFCRFPKAGRLGPLPHWTTRWSNSFLLTCVPKLQTAPSHVTLLTPLFVLQRIGALTTKPSSRKKPVISKRDWAHVVDVNRELLNFKQLVPDMAKEVRKVIGQKYVSFLVLHADGGLLHVSQWPFELDTFQKEAVYHMWVSFSLSPVSCEGQLQDLQTHDSLSGKMGTASSLRRTLQLARPWLQNTQQLWL